MPPLPGSYPTNRATAQAFALATFAATWLAVAWLCDDAFITLRHVDNFLDGHGPRFNLAERVIGFTHPLWFFVLVPVWALTHSPAWTLFLPSFLVSMAAFGVALRAQTASAILLVATGLLASRSFVDWSSSGLENPLAHLLAALLVQETLGAARLGRTATLAGLLALTRPELLLLALPATVRALVRSSRTWGGRLATLCLAWSPALVWHSFCLFWTGAPVPNTAFAKLPPGFPAIELVQQGLLYLMSSVLWDPPTLTTIVVALVLCRRAGSAEGVLALGIVLDLVAVVRVGGDFMNGRFLTPAFFVAVLLLARCLQGPRVRIAACAALVALGLGSSHLSPWSDEIIASRPRIDERGVADERAWYAEGTSLRLARRDRPIPRASFVRSISAQWDGRDPVAVAEAIGMLALYAGPGVHVIDRNGLTDPYLARLPVDSTKPWRIGHMTREVPPDYIDWVRNTSAESAQADPLVTYVHSATRSPLFSRDRLRVVLLGSPPLP